ncbi:MAG: homoserine O-succinyltransferase [Pseudobdellovibrionaceae bacterium]
MPIKIADTLPARAVLEAEGVMVMDETTAFRQDIRPLQIGLLNLMPNKIETETQFARLIGATPLQVELTLIRVGSHKSKNTDEEHLITYYETWNNVKHRKFDGLIITGAPVEQLPFEQVTYWRELRQILDWTQTNVHRLFTVCWGAQAAAYHFHGIGKHALPEKAWGVFAHHNIFPASPYLRGFSDEFFVPVSRWSEIRKSDIPNNKGLTILAENKETGVFLLEDAPHRALYMFNHMEYDTHALAREYERDAQGNVDAPCPKYYFPDDDVTARPKNNWRSHAHLLFGNWINEIYQTTPYEIEAIGMGGASQVTSAA